MTEGQTRGAEGWLELTRLPAPGTGYQGPYHRDSPLYGHSQGGPGRHEALQAPMHVAHSHQQLVGSELGGDARASSWPGLSRAPGPKFSTPPPQRRWLTARPSTGSPPGGVRTTVAQHPRTGARRSPAQVGLTLQVPHSQGHEGWGVLGLSCLCRERAWWQSVAACGLV